jgi:PKD repeat protein
MKCLPICLLIVVMVYFAIPANTQSNMYILNGSARQDNCNCYTLTNSSNSQSGSVWNADKINLNNSFDFIFNVYLGCKDGDGADGMVFILQPLSTSIGAAGGGMGFYGVAPSVGIALDTWRNTGLNDPSFDHISIQVNGNSNHANDLAGPVQASATSVNIEDCKWHTLRISWDASAHWLRSYFDNVPRVQAQVDLIANVFRNDSMVFWGFGASTGAYNNQQKFCTALTPSFTSNFTNNANCVGNSVVFQNQSRSFAPIRDHYWDFGDGITSNAADPAHIYSAPGLYTVKLTETGLDGCNSDTARKIIEIGDYPIADFDIFDSCTGKAPRIIDRSSLKLEIGWK